MWLFYNTHISSSVWWKHCSSENVKFSGSETEKRKSALIPARLPGVSEFIQLDLNVFHKTNDGLGS